MITCYSFVKGSGLNSTLTVKQVGTIKNKVKELPLDLGANNCEADLVVSNWKPALWISIGTAASLLLVQVYRVGLFHHQPRPIGESELENYIPS